MTTVEQTSALPDKAERELIEYLPRRGARVIQNALVDVAQPRKLPSRLFAIHRRQAEPGRYRDISGHRDGGSAKGLDSFRDHVDQLDLFRMMLVEKRMQLVKRGAGGLPVILLVKVAQRHRIGE